MEMPRVGRGVLFAMLTAACGGNHTSPSAPSTASVVSATSTFHVAGVATDDDGNPVAGANITVQPRVQDKSVPAVVVVTDGAGRYGVDFDANRDSAGIVATVKAQSPGHDTANYEIIPASASQNTSQNIHLYRIKRISVGESTDVTFLPSDTSCREVACEAVIRTVRIVVPSDGVMTIEAVRTPSTTNAVFNMGVAGPDGEACCDTPASIPVAAGTEVVASIAVFWLWTLPDSQSFVLNTSLVRR